ncbi:hypothetical protein HD806DRAFT_519651 [Xylariaceae sp. AK1471]|nr:hypothetical protein HD806DRAFT_519651 [Xylariaceae sp. AK1471]
MSAFAFNNPSYGFYDATDSPVIKDDGFLQFQAGDAHFASEFDSAAIIFPKPQRPRNASRVTNISQHRQSSHRGSTSSSSSLRSTDSNSPHTSHTSTDVTMDTSPRDWTFGNTPGTEDNFMMDEFLNLPSASSSPSPPVTNAPSPRFHMPTESLPQGPAVKRRKAQETRRTEQLLNQSTKSPVDFSPVSTQIPSSETSPAAVYANNLPSPDGNTNTLGDVYAMGMTPSWGSALGAQVNHTYSQQRSSSTYVPSHGLPVCSPPALLPLSPSPRLVIHPMPAKSRVETQIPLKITLHNLPKGIKRVHLPTHTIAKPKLLHKSSSGPTPDMLELTTMLICTSAMSEPGRLERAYRRAAEKPHTIDLNSPSDGTEDEENMPQNGGEVRICSGCIIRERKRASRKKHKKPEEDELWDRYEKDRAIVFNTHEVKDWQTVTPVMADPTGAGLLNGTIPEGTVQVDAPMRIACYCRHHGEKSGFQVIITLKDHTGNLVAQGISSSIMITDDHKTHIPAHAGATPTPQTSPRSQSLSQPQHPPQPNPQPLASHEPTISSQPVTTHPAPIHSTRVQPSLAFRPNSGDTSSLPFSQSHSTTDLQSLATNPAFTFPSDPPTNISQTASIAATPRSFSRQTSPASPLGIGNRKRKASMVSKIPNGLAMTKIDTRHSSPSMPLHVQNEPAVNSVGNSPFSPNNTHYPINGDISNQGQQHMLNNVLQSLGAGPVTPNNNGADQFMFPTMNNRAMNFEVPANQLLSAPVSAHPSRAPSPSQMRTDLQYLPHSQRAQDVLSGSTMPPPTILRIIPNEGPKSGGVEITVLGRNFTNDGLEVYFGSHKATTTTFWGETSLVCLLPPAPSAGVVPVTINQPGRRQAIQQPAIFKYVDDNEEQLIRTALAVLGNKYGGGITDAAEIARSILCRASATSGSSNQAPNGNGSNNFTNFSLESGEAVESGLLQILELIDLDDSPNRARINLRRSSGQTMLHLACSLGFIRFVAGLLSRGANVNISDEGGFTPLHMAAMNDHPEIVRRLIIKGADRNACSHSNLTPMDVASSRPVLRSLQHIESHSRSRSAGSLHSRASSSNSIQSHWATSTMTPMQRQEFLLDTSDSANEVGDNDSSEDGTTEEEDRSWLDMRRASFVGPRHGSTAVATPPVNEADGGPASPSATMAAIREQVATQLQQFQHTMAMHLQNLPQFQMPNMPQMPQMPQMPNLPPMPVLPDYHAYLHSAPVMQRISSLVPNIRGQRPESVGDQSSNHSDNKWGVFPFFGNRDSPPAYEDIFPQEEFDIKQASAVQAAADFEADAKCAAHFDQDSAETSQAEEVPPLLQIGRKHLITKEQQETLQRAHAQRLKAGSSDKMLWFVWIPILVLVLGAMLWSGAPSLVSGTTSVAKAFAGLVTNPRDFSNRVRHLVQELAQ